MKILKQLFCAHYWVENPDFRVNRKELEARFKTETTGIWHITWICRYCGKVKIEKKSWIPLNFIG